MVSVSANSTLIKLIWRLPVLCIRWLIQWIAGATTSATMPSIKSATTPTMTRIKGTIRDILKFRAKPLEDVDVMIGERERTSSRHLFFSVFSLGKYWVTLRSPCFRFCRCIWRLRIYMLEGEDKAAVRASQTAFNVFSLMARGNVSSDRDEIKRLKIIRSCCTN